MTDQYEFIVLVCDGVSWHIVATDVSRADTGDVKATVRQSAPTGWLLCDGSKKSATTYESLLIVMLSDIADWGRGAAHSTFTVDTATDELISVAHGLAVDAVVYFNTSGTMPGGITADTKYFVISITADRFKISITKGGAAIDIISAGSGTHSIYDGFLVPDFRGRTPLGADNMGGASADRVTDSQADNLGQGAGAESNTLPNHLHSGSAAHTATNGQGDIQGSGNFAWLSAQTFAHGNTGNPTTSPSIGAVQPYQTVNYIVKT